VALFVGQDLDEGEPGRIVDCDMHEFPTCGFTLAAPIAGNWRADAPEARELLGIEVNELAGAGAAVTLRRLSWRQLAPQVDDRDHQGVVSFLATKCNAELRFSRPAARSLRKRASHLWTVRANLEPSGDGRHAPSLLEHAVHHHGSTERRRMGIPMAFIRAILGGRRRLAPATCQASAR
jgi:hypothetical protein